MPNPLSWLSNQPKPINAKLLSDAKDKQNQLTKPPGSLGELEGLAQQFCGWQNTLNPKLDIIIIRIFAGDHGIAAKGVSAFPQAVTAQMIQNFLSGGAAINVLARLANADFSVVNLGTVGPIDTQVKRNPSYQDRIIAKQTQDFSEQAAMSENQLEQALNTGKEQAEQCVNIKEGEHPAVKTDTRSDTKSERSPYKGTETITAQLFIGGEMGIGNTSAATAIYSAIFNENAENFTGPGTGLDAEACKAKSHRINQALELHKGRLDSPLDILRILGGFEIAALVGAYLRAPQLGIPVVVDGFICGAAALLACKLQPKVRDWFIFSHQSAEPAHKRLLAHLDAKPLLDLGLRLGEGSGAALCVPILKSAVELHNGMASFSSAAVSTQSN
ncbi:MAG: nicotinate-nucleotide--dimethylbenzimidazole phosphoribosyltransferase [Flavobacteriales bacterium]|jgi:nicotinate-nucleotide--dimethylbenzimidazole phosphoribosyltransferase